MAAAGEEEQPPCGLCGAAAAPYTCPRCNRRLCSLGCYRGHGGCAEAFYREQVLQALETERDPPPSHDRLASAFRRLRQLGEAEDAAGPLGRDLWKSLSPAERAGFQRLLSSGEAATLLPAWRPWWWRRRRRLGEELGKPQAGKEEEGAPSPPPFLPAVITPLSSLRAPPPSPLVPFQLPNVLFGYAFALSLHSGDETLLPELPAAVLDVSAALRGRRAFASAAEALHAARYDVSVAGYPQCPLGDAGTVLAVVQILEGREGRTDGEDVAVALLHLERLFRKGESHLPKEERRRFSNARRKCRYLLAWSREAPETLAALAEETRVVHAGVAQEAAVLREEAERGCGGPWRELISDRVNEGLGERRLIQELD
ncbi:PREDICTED: zinc finger HIT domain-containing protein 2 [Haliaeetus leucocephalus]|uniref:zinc finger HIT domain-containing protein 2 n=1 Tax=Haliaeetus leucocephalus TaxID=52644 RepID=UPI00053CAF74|nr:PREDICTED: zinc finger HIT domain-containing protein 2 [Haliaeetus leucocephalus]